MRLALDPRTRRLLRRVPHTTVYSAMELALLSLLAIQCARFFWVILTPVGPLGEWRAADTLRPAIAGSTELLGSFDPFFRLAGDGGPLVVTALDLTLHGVREDRASGRGSAIISTPDGQQKSYIVGEEIMPGVILSAVSFDNVTISRGGVAEQIYLDQSTPAPAPSSPSASVPVPARSSAPSLKSEIQYQPRLDGGRITGIVVQPQGIGGAFRAAGLEPGDVVLSVNGQAITSAQQASALGGQLGSGDVTVQVERGGRTFPLRVKANQ